RFNRLITDLRAPTQRASGPVGLVHVADNPDIAGPGPRISMTPVKLRNHGNLVAIEALTHSEGEAKPNPGLGLDREIEVVGVAPLVFVQELYRSLTAFLQTAPSVDFQLGGSRWLFEQVAAEHFVTSARWPELAELYQRVTREYAVDDSFEKVLEAFAPGTTENGETEVKLGIEYLHRCHDTDPDIANFVHVVKLAVAADEVDTWVTSEAVAHDLQLDGESCMKLGRLLRAEKDVWRDGDAEEDFASWNFQPSLNVHFFRRIGSIDDYLAIQAALNPASSNGNGAAKPRRRAVGQQILVSETTYAIVGDVRRDDLQLVRVGQRRLEGHDRPEQVYVLQHPEVVLEATVPED